MNRRAELYCWLVIVLALVYWTAHVLVAVIRGSLGGV